MGLSVLQIFGHKSVRNNYSFSPDDCTRLRGKWTKCITIHLKWNMNACTKRRCRPSNSRWAVSAWTKVEDRPTDAASQTPLQLASLKRKLVRFQDVLLSARFSILVAYIWISEQLMCENCVSDSACFHNWFEYFHSHVISQIEQRCRADLLADRSPGSMQTYSMCQDNEQNVK